MCLSVRTCARDRRQDRLAWWVYRRRPHGDHRVVRGYSPEFKREKVSQRFRSRAGARRTLIAMWSQRSLIDYSLARRAVLTALVSGATTTTDVCDADPYLLRAAHYHGEPTQRDCPVCQKEKLTHVTYVFGDELGQYSGRIRATKELETMAHEHGEFRVYVVEVCQGCAWNHLTVSYVLGDGMPRAAARGARAKP